MSEFDIHKYKKNQYLAEAGLGSSPAQSLATSIDNAIGGVDESLSSRDFAIAVSIILKEKFPSNEDFGKTAWTYYKYGDALRKYEELESKAVKIKVTVDNTN